MEGLNADGTRDGENRRCPNAGGTRDGGSLPLICEKCGSEMSIVAFIIDPEQIDRIMQHLIKQGRPLSCIHALRVT
jgi:hypothetical protein